VRITARIRLSVSAFKGGAEGFRIQGLAPTPPRSPHLEPVGPGHLHPALAELFAVVPAEHLVRPCEHVDGIPASIAGRAAAGWSASTVRFGP